MLRTAFAAAPVGLTIVDRSGRIVRVNAAMANMVGLFAPDYYREWPAVDVADPYYRRDLVDLLANGATDSVIVGSGVRTAERGH